MAQGDIVSVTIEATGWSAIVEVEGYDGAEGTVTYDYGLGVDNDPANATVVFTVKSMGYNNAGSPDIKTRTVYGVQTIRQAYPNHALLDESPSAGNLLIRVALSDYIYAKDDLANSGALPTVSFAASWGVAATFDDTTITTDLVTVNSSAVAYPKVIGHFALEDRRPVNGPQDIEVFAIHKYAQEGSPVSFVFVGATGVSSSNVESGSATAMTKSNRADELPVYSVALDLSVSAGYILGEVVNINFIATPWIGDADSVLDATVDAGTQTFQLNPLHWNVMNKMIAVVDTGAGGPGTASETQATADADPFTSLTAAMSGIMAQNNTDHSINRADGGEIQMKAGTYDWDGSVANTIANGYVTIAPHSSTNRAGVIFDGWVNSRSQELYQRFYNVTITRAASDAIIFSFNNAVLVMESINFADVHSGGWYSGDTDSNVEFLDCIYNNGRFSKGGNDGHSRLHRSCTYTPTYNDDAPTGEASFVFGFTGTDSVADMYGLLTSAGINNKIIAYCSCLNWQGGLLNSVSAAKTNFAIVNNVIERVGADPTPILELSSGGGGTVSNMVLWHNSFSGQRFNHENDIVAPYVNGTFTNFASQGNIFATRGDHRADIFASDALLIGCWPVGYSVGWLSNHNEAYTNAGDTDFWGIISNTGSGESIAPPEPVGYVDDQSVAVGGGGNGDYHLDPASEAIGKMQIILLPYDIEGTARFIDSPTNGGAAGAYEFGEILPPSIINYTRGLRGRHVDSARFR